MRVGLFVRIGVDAVKVGAAALEAGCSGQSGPGAETGASGRGSDDGAVVDVDGGDKGDGGAVGIVGDEEGSDGGTLERSTSEAGEARGTDGDKVDVEDVDEEA